MYHNTTISMASNPTILFCRDKFNKEFANAVNFAVRSCCGDYRLALEAVLEALGHVSSIILHSTGKITFMQMNKIIRPPVGADLSCTPPIDRPWLDVPLSQLFCEKS